MDKNFFDSVQVVLNNGIRITTIKKTTQLGAIHCGINAGSLHEKKEHRGISHFTEHMLFKGTANRSNVQLNTELENLGGEYNAYTDLSSTVYSVTALAEELDNSLELLSDMLISSNFPQEEIEKEKGVILAEIRNSNDDVEDLSFSKVNSIAFKNSPLKISTLGDEASVKKINRKELVDFFEANYLPNNCYISIVSPYDHELVVSSIKKYFGNWEQKKIMRNQVVSEKNIETKKTSYKNDIQQSTVVFLYNFLGLNNKEELALGILNHKLGASANSILFRKLREEKGLAYDVYSDLDNTKDVKLLYIYTAVANENVRESIDIINTCIDKIKKREIIFDEETIWLMKKALKTDIASTLEDSTDLGNYVLHRDIENKSIHGFEENLILLEEITAEDIYNVAHKVFNGPTIHVLLSRESD